MDIPTTPNALLPSDQEKREFGKSFQDYFKKLSESAGTNLNQVNQHLLPSDSFGQWAEADEGADDTR